ncbi:MAG TPA: hypothetical protein DCS93_17590 [Microscillaceae bacterium]|nr:hypothetical protein [Microscillaceae bacterium]
MNKPIYPTPTKSNIDQKSAALWQNYPKEHEEEFWIHYERLLNAAGAQYEAANIQQVRQNTEKLPFASVLRVAPKKRPKLQEVIEQQKPGYFPVVMGVLGSLVALPLLFDAQLALLLFVGAAFVFIVSVGMLLYGINNFKQYGELKDLFGAVLEVNNASITRTHARNNTKVVHFKDISTVSNETYGLVIKVKNQNNQETKAMMIPFAIEQFEQLKAFLYQQVRKNNKFRPDLQGLNVIR